MRQLTGLPGVRRKNVQCKMVRSVTAAMTVTRDKAIIAANDTGSIAVWIDDSNAYRAALSRRWITHEEGTFKTKRELREWLVEFWPQM